MTTSKRALVTGANKGIGLETARRLAATGFKVWLGARAAERGAAAAQALRNEGLDVEWLELDVVDDESAAVAARTVAARVASLDVLVNNAGIAPGYVDALGPDERYELPPSRENIADIKATYDVNVFGPIRVTQAFLPLLLASPAGRIVMVSSYIGSIARAQDATGENQSPNIMGYGSSKTALNAITVAFARELAPRGIKVNAAAPGYTATDLNGHRGGRTVQQAAEIIVRLATLDADGPTAGYFDENGPLRW
ncbi:MULTISPECIES: SDR family NAD(P)-dependent oxidoreductase [unclassified Mesorhizobium]|uniref:SDR family NAD(P)-dependent oxidoreductase n=1 Tax=unclassified Mesorhizobium TaxID=325217 RepID=UPI001CC9A37B|nr:MULTISPECIES: SDR family NAD(P)-dependent oxidoreductase [unclassified Mesorhizobium]MBZ9999736.1 SDR family NAD(P)-dependent oxidoreductase [Mesorhizobium sp. B264B2A]MCA0005530.1 SDR family NAD(P)-dependent oxidoreductase [Mesorhizobium sp. B264B1B]MCA0019958.1 SDR family NAD(P)-dependent oxidoreductase [Mesorhizobium sp. B264B1A]